MAYSLSRVYIAYVPVDALMTTMMDISRPQPDCVWLYPIMSDCVWLFLIAYDCRAATMIT